MVKGREYRSQSMEECSGSARLRIRCRGAGFSLWSYRGMNRKPLRVMVVHTSATGVGYRVAAGSLVKALEEHPGLAKWADEAGVKGIRWWIGLSWP